MINMKFVDTKTGLIYEIEYDDLEKKYCIKFYHSADKYYHGWIGGATTVRYWKTISGAINYLKKKFKGRLKER